MPSIVCVQGVTILVIHTADSYIKCVEVNILEERALRQLKDGTLLSQDYDVGRTTHALDASEELALGDPFVIGLVGLPGQEKSSSGPGVDAQEVQAHDVSMKASCPQCLSHSFAATAFPVRSLTGGDVFPGCIISRDVLDWRRRLHGVYHFP
ncbi:hypothetical protein ACOMHN_034695 [Nucella lapillus]